MATTGSVAAAPEQRVELQVPSAGPFMLLAARGARAVSEQCSQETEGTENSTARGPFDVGVEMQHSHEHDLCWN